MHFLMRCPRRLLWTLGIGMIFGPCVARAQAPEAAGPALQVIIEQNRRLQEQVKEQQKTIQELKDRMDEIRKASERHERELQSLQARADAGPPERAVPVESHEHEVRVGGEAGLAFFHTGSDGQFPHGDFRVDDVKLTVEAPVWKNVYFYTALDLFGRESEDGSFELYELYVEFEGLGRAWGMPDALSLRAGRINTPFGEEYLFRSPMTNPLISHSLSDIWGPDEGVEIFGSFGSLQYIVAVLNGGDPQSHDYNSDKAIVARVGWDPRNWLHLSVSAMRTGKLATVSPTTQEGDGLSAIWFGNGFFRSLGPASRTNTFSVDLYEADAVVRWPGGHVSAALGEANYADSDPLVDNSRRLHYGYLEATQNLTDELYGAARYSAINAPDGYPIAGNGEIGDYFFGPERTLALRRFTLGFGYRFGPPLVLKLEYSWEWGRMTNGESRNHEDFLGAEVGLKF
jgi:hypothetical protein